MRSVTKSKTVKKQSGLKPDAILEIDYLKMFPQVEKFILEPGFDIYQHMKHNIKNNSSNCEIHDSTLTFYCMSCRRSICDVCKETFHNAHVVVNKLDVSSDLKFINALFKRLEDNILTTNNLVQPEQLIAAYKNKAENEFESIQKRLNELKEKRLKEIETMFGGNTGDSKMLMNIVSKTKKSMVTYYQKYQEFLDNKNVNDDDNFIFLHLYDLINDCISKNIEYNTLIEKIKTFYLEYQKNNDSKYDNIIKEIDLCLASQKRNDINNANLKVLEAQDGNFEKKDEFKQKLIFQFEKLNEDLYLGMRNKINLYENHYEQFKTFVYESFKKGGSLAEIDRIVKTFEEKLAKKVNYSGAAGMKLSYSSRKSGILRKSRESSPTDSKNKNILLFERNTISTTNGLVSVNELEEQKSLKSFKNNKEDKDSNIDEDDIKDNNEEKEEIIVNIKENQNKTKKEYSKLDKMFRPKPNNTKKEKEEQKIDTTRKLADKYVNSSKDNTKEKEKRVNQKLIDNLKEIEQQNELIKKRDDVNIKIPLIRKYFSYSTLEFVQKSLSTHHIRQSSGALFEHINNINSNDSNFKIIEGSNEIMIYSRKKRTMIKKKIFIDKQKFGTSIFHHGCKYIIVNGKAYISGGKSVDSKKSLFWCYNFNDNKLSKLQDSKFPHSYHSITYHENLRSIILFGGEDSGKCEMYDIYLNIWNELPDLNIPRAKINLYIDRLGVYVYAIFGIKGNIGKGEFSDVIEVLDLIDSSKGWARIDYKNKSLVDMRKGDIKVFELSGDKILLYGAVENRDTIHCHVVFDLRNFDIYKIDDKDLEYLKVRLSLPVEILVQSDK